MNSFAAPYGAQWLRLGTTATLATVATFLILRSVGLELGWPRLLAPTADAQTVVATMPDRTAGPVRPPDAAEPGLMRGLPVSAFAPPPRSQPTVPVAGTRQGARAVAAPQPRTPGDETATGSTAPPPREGAPSGASPAAPSGAGSSTSSSSTQVDDALPAVPGPVPELPVTPELPPVAPELPPTLPNVPALPAPTLPGAPALPVGPLP